MVKEPKMFRKNTTNAMFKMKWFRQNLLKSKTKIVFSLAVCALLKTIIRGVSTLG
jgi:hypothetical protein